MKKTVIVGSGIAGLMSALVLVEKGHKNITIIEKENELGGLLRKFDYGEYGIFDYGMHNILETGIEDLDTMIYDLLKNDEWHILEKEKRDLAGLFFNGRLQLNSPYIDLRFTKNYTEYINSFFTKSLITSKDIDSYKNCSDYLKERYGELISNDVVTKVLSKLYKKNISELDVMSTLITPLDRMILLDANYMDEINKSEVLRSVLAYPEQRKLNQGLSSGKRALYPKGYGIYRVVDAIIEKLEARGVEFLLNTKVDTLDVINSSIEKVTLDNNTHINAKKIIWTGDISALLPLLKSVDRKDYSFDKKPKTVVVSLLIDKKLKLEDLYYIYCSEESLSTFRVTAYYNYCDAAKTKDGYLISVDMLIYDEKFSNEMLSEMAIKELKYMKLLGEDSNVIFSKAEVLAAGFPMPTVKNMNTYDKIRNEIDSLSIKNLEKIGILSEKNLFFQTDVLIDLYDKLSIGIN